MAVRNFLVIMMDELSRDGVGCYGGTTLTPHIDTLAARGTRFAHAYTPSPICVPARAAFHTGLYVHQNRCWTNAQPYHGQIDGWPHHLRRAGYETVSIGKLHYRSAQDDNGFDREIVPLHCVGGEGWVMGLLRRQDHTCYDASGFAADIGPGDDPYTDYDRTVRDRTLAWLRDESRSAADSPWSLFVSFVRPHYPLTCPQEFLDLYDPDRLPPIRHGGARAEYRHPVLNAMRQYCDYDDHFPDDRARAVARASYFGLCSFVDALVGDVLRALEAAGRLEDTAIVLTADHGEMNGHHGFWTKMVMYEDAIGEPLILAGPGAPRGTCESQASLVDILPTALDAAQMEGGAVYPGTSLFDLANAPDDPDRTVLSEYHDGGSITGFLSLRCGRWKYVAYPGFAPQLFDLASDPDETVDLGLSADHEGVRDRMRARMTSNFGDPDAINDRAFADQAARIEELGGVAAIRARTNYDHTPISYPDED